MIALLRYLRTDEPTGLHRTYLRVDGSIAALPVLPSVECLTVHDEIDESGANARGRLVPAPASGWPQAPK